MNRSRYIGAVLYTEGVEDKTKFELLQKIEKGEVEGVFIKHSPEAEGKKYHFHVILRYKEARSISAVSKEFGISENYFQKISNLDGALLYLLHKGYSEKLQYKEEEIKGGSIYLKDRLHKLLIKSELTDEDILINIAEYIKNSAKLGEYLDTFDLLDFVTKSGYLSIYKKYYIIVKDLLKESKSYKLVYTNENIKEINEKIVHCCNAWDIESIKDKEV